MLDHYEIENLEQLRAVSDLLRTRIVDLLRDRPRTVTQLAELLGMTPARVHYHVRELEKVGLLRLAETREKGGILEKYYQPIARDISIPRNLLFSAPPDEVIATTATWFNQIKENFLQSMQKQLRQKDESQRMQATFSFAHIYVTHEEFEQLYRQISEIFQPFEKRRGIEGEQEMLTTLIISPQHPATPEAVSATPTEASGENVGVAVSSTLSEEAALNTWVLGVTNFTRAQLEDVLGEGKRLHISVVGLCRFSDDVTAELADQAVESFRLVGKLQAPAQVYEVLMSKRQA